MPEPHSLPPDLRELWRAYQLAEERLPRAQKLARLNEFIAALAAFPVERWNDWALAVARECSDVGKQFEIRMPLFRSALFPVLRQAIRDRVPGAARWLAGLIQHLYRANDCLVQLPPEQQSEIGLLLLALEHDPHDDAARRKLIAAFQWQLDYSIHEIPAGVLFGHDGATISQCAELEAQLDHFCRLVGAAELAPHHQALIDECRYHYRHYAAYLSQPGRFKSYAEYLADVGRKPE